ncbi:NUDIX domain-containing protein [Arthrobacter sp. ATA002]|uniref:NUDIX domain-containing protein n=1 Tax=Arthrobacter sp. ATA002 TaxID=2991715 RepID=UPI0022A66518|nr:NUDIX domain-containing protein [Arthrobacter sp. ATA002]WAP52628.1 NUDIX domain-containing protein [Arthrobacter sp. ATA002]
MAEDFDVRVGAYAVIIRDGSILLAHWNDHGYSSWTLPGGGLEAREDAPAAVVREVREETGFTVEAGELLGVDSIFIPPEHRFPGGERRLLHALRIIYRARVTSGCWPMNSAAALTARSGWPWTGSPNSAPHRWCRWG